MIVYILPENREQFEKKVVNASKHLENPPKVTFSEPMVKTKETVVNWKCDDETGSERHRQVITVIEVTIDDITSGDWSLVADVYYRERIVGMVNGTYYKDMPKQFGLDYAKCDYCGGIDHDRKLSHIVYNRVTGEWKQVGSSCAKKMFQHGDLSRYTVELRKIINLTFACAGDESWGCWCGRVPDHSWQIAYNIDSVLAAIVGYRKDVSSDWVRSYYDSSTRQKEPGTTQFLRDYYNEHETELKIDDEYNAKVRSFVAALPEDTRTDYDPCTSTSYQTEGFNSKIKRAFEDGFILYQDFYTAFFAVKMYEDSKTLPEFETLTQGMEKGSYVDLNGASLVSKFSDEGYYGWVTVAKFEYNGVVFAKEFSNWGSTEASYKKEDGLFYFSAPVKYVSRKNREVWLCGSCRKLKAVKS